MKTITKKIGASLMMLSIVVGLTAQVRWNPEDWKDGVPDAANKVVVRTPGAQDDVTRVRGDMTLQADIRFTDAEPYFAFMLTTENCKLDLNDWKLQIMCQRRFAEGTQNADGSWSYGASQSSLPHFNLDKRRFVEHLGADEFTLVGYENNLLVGTDPYPYNTCIWVVDLENEAINEGNLLIDGFFDLPYFPTHTRILEDGTPAVVDAPIIYDQRSWVSMVIMAREADASKAKFNLHYAATIESPTDALTFIETYKAGNGGKEVREGDPASVNNTNTTQLSIWQNGSKIIAPQATKLDVYSATGTLVKSINASEISLIPGFYIVKAYKDQRHVSAKVIVR